MKFPTKSSPALAPRHQLPLAHRRLGAQPRLEDDQAALRQPRCPRFGLFALRLSIADDLGGEAAYINLRDRAYHHGIRLASDMVPNHMGIDSPWVIEHPEWFISRRDSPYPSYSFEGPDLSHDGRVELKIEDHYYDAIRRRGHLSPPRQSQRRNPLHLPWQQRLK